MLSYVAPYRGSLVLVVVFSMVSVSMTLWTPILIGDAVDRILGPGGVDYAGIAPILLRMLAAIGAIPA